MPAIERAGGGLRYRQRNQLYRNLGDGRFREIANESDSRYQSGQPWRGQRRLRR